MAINSQQALKRAMSDGLYWPTEGADGWWWGKANSTQSEGWLLSRKEGHHWSQPPDQILEPDALAWHSNAIFEADHTWSKEAPSGWRQYDWRILRMSSIKNRAMWCDA
jgi:hypothetical protein